MDNINVKSIIKDSMILFFITLILGVCLSVAKVVTAPAIAKANEEAKIKAFNQVCPGFNSYEDVTMSVIASDDVVVNDTGAMLNKSESVLIAKDITGNVIGYIVRVVGVGYGGPLNLIVGFDLDKNITSVTYESIPQETPGVGMKTTKQNFLDRWKGKNSENVENVDGISGATMTSDGFRDAVKVACEMVGRID